MENVSLYPRKGLLVTERLRKRYSSIKSIFSDIAKCPECAGKRLKHSSSGEVFCRDCGLVIL